MSRDDLRLPAGLTALALLAVSLDVPWLGVAAGLLLALVLPGYALVRALFGSAVPAVERLLLSVALSLAIDVLGGLVLDLSPWGLDTRAWSVLLGAVALAGLLAAARRPGRLPSSSVRSFPRLSAGSVGVALASGAGVAVVAVTVGLSGRAGPPPAAAQGSTILSMVPTDNGREQLELRSGEFAPTTYQVEVTVDEGVVRRWKRIVLRPGERWRSSVRRPARGVVRATVYRAGSAAPYRQVHDAVAPGALAAAPTGTTAP